MNIVTAGNSATACLQAVLDKGFKVRAENDELIAEKDQMIFAAEGPIELLGLVTLGEMYGDKWQELGCERDAWEQVST